MQWCFNPIRGATTCSSSSGTGQTMPLWLKDLGKGDGVGWVGRWGVNGITASEGDYIVGQSSSMIVNPKPVS